MAAEIERQAEQLGINYLLSYLFLGTMSLSDALRSLELFRAEVMTERLEAAYRDALTSVRGGVLL